MVSDPDTPAVLIRNEADADRVESQLATLHTLATGEVRLRGVHHELVRPADAEALINEEDFAMDERLPYWADLWPSATVLAEHLAAMAGDGRALLELGCGLGLVSAAAAAAGFEVTATDYYADALPFAALNAWRIAGRAITTGHLDWRSLPEGLGTFDLVVASDVLYEREYAPLVAEVLARTLRPGGTGWVADPGRVAIGAFVEECNARSLAVERHAEVGFEDGAQRQRIALYRIERR